MYDLSKIKSINCADVASKYGVRLKQQGDRLWGKIREGEKTSSFCINIKKNLWVDYGNANKGGSVIDLVMELEGVNKEEAINKLARDYNIEHIDKGKGTGNKWSSLTDSQYRELGIQPERATMNFKFDLTKHSMEQLERWSEKYGMPVKNLALKYPGIYNKLINKIAMEGINILKDSYHTKLKLYNDPSNNEITKAFLKHTCTQDATELNKKIDLLQKAITTKSSNYNSLKVNLENDLKEKTYQKSQEKSQIPKPITEDEKIRDRIVNVYKKLFDYNFIDYFTVEQAKALKDINIAISKDNNKFVPIESIKKAYTLLGDNIDKLQKDYTQALKNNNSNIERIKLDLLKVKDLFTKASVVIEGVREANINIKKDLARQNSIEKLIQKNVEFTQ